MSWQLIALRVLALIGAFVVAMQMTAVAVKVIVMIVKSPLVLIAVVMALILTTHYRRQLRSRA